MPLTGGFYCDGLALDGVSFTGNEDTDLPAVFRSFDVVVHLRAWPQIDDMTTDLEFVAIDGKRRLNLGTIAEIRVRAGRRPHSPGRSRSAPTISSRSSV